MSLGMIGAIGGLGKGLSEESAFLAREDAAAAESQRQKDYQGWLLKTQQEYEVQREQRAEDRTIRTEQRTDVRNEQQKDRDFERTQNEAPVRRGIKVEDEKATARGKSEVAGETLETDANVASTMAEAKQTKADKALKGAQAEFYGQKGDSLGTKLDPVDATELKGIQSRAGKLEDAITKAKADGSWSGTPEQKQLQSQLVALQLRERQIIQKYRSAEGGGAPDPLGLRKPVAGGTGGGGAAPAPAPRKGGMISQQPGDTDRAAILTQEMRQARERLAGAKTDDERRRAQGDIDALTREMRAAGVAVPDAGAAPAQAAAPAAPQPAAPAVAAAPRPAAPAPAAAPAAPAEPASPAESIGRELDASRAEFKAFTEPSKRPGLKAGVAAREEYARKVETLKAKIREQEKRYADAVGNQGAAFVYR